MQAARYGQAEEVRERLELTPEETAMAEDLRNTWADILKVPVGDETDFFVAGAGSMDVVRSDGEDGLDATRSKPCEFACFFFFLLSVRLLLQDLVAMCI